ncbi:MAG: SulP family inorganic anion transporter [Proteobacteria bacterium]|nr:SulP family inorganic anion transporter [Pseudomonadota bacterium]MBU1232284.1 SulP family inorganic anion transporter [Pseudomonadota bacterium]MBU1419427.1 SulP family inorganic anion transporter [Pseudomonadota bacterium]MBU1456304.1 SulP family inorganic anion transporter [Pseudomonadota bacterium]
MDKKWSQAGPNARLNTFMPFLKWWPRVTPSTFRADLTAGLTGAVVALPQGVAFATIAGMPPEYGLYAGMIPAIVAALFGSSWLLVSGPTTAASIVLFSSLSAYAPPGSAEYVSLALTLTMMVGLIQFGMGLARFGALVNFISHSVVVGFTAGAAILIAASQLKHFLGLTLPRSRHLYETLEGVIAHLDKANLYTVAAGAITLLSGLLVKRFWPKFPYMIISMLVGSLAALLMTHTLGPEVTQIVSVGAMPTTLPPLSAPHFTLHNIKMLAPAAVAMTLFALTEAISIARSLAERSGQNLDGNQEFIGQGMSNMIGCFFSGYVATGSFNRSGLNYQAGAKTPLAAIFAGSLLIVLVMLVGPLAAYLPNAAMAGILFLVAWGLIDFKHIAKIFKTSRMESVIMTATFLATLFLELEFAILLGVTLSLIMYLNRTSHPKMLSRIPDPHQEDRPFTSDPMLPECPQLKIVRIDGSLYFGAVNHVKDRLQEMQLNNPNQKHLLIVASGINFIDMAGAEFLIKLAKEKEAAGGRLYLYDIKEGICAYFRLANYLLDIGTDYIYDSKKDALADIYTRLDKQICADCKKRIFLECRSIEKAEASVTDR